MIDWLRRAPQELPTVDVDGRMLPVVLRRLDHARRLTMRLAPDGSEVRVSLPRWTPSGEAMAFVRSRSDWLGAQLAKLQPPRSAALGTSLPYRGASLTIRHDPLAPRRPAREGDVVVLGGTAESLSRRLQRWLEEEALRVLAGELAHYCALAAQPLPELALSRAQRRWGSCSARGMVRINWRLIMAPDLVRRSVVAHEVAHLVHFDHSPAFHARLAELFEDDIESANRWLRREGRSLYAWFG